MIVPREAASLPAICSYRRHPRGSSSLRHRMDRSWTHLSGCARTAPTCVTPPVRREALVD